MSNVPLPPFKPEVVSVTEDSVLVTFSDSTTGGAAIDSRQIGYNNNIGAPHYTTPSDGSTIIGGLDPGTTYYFWARTHNVNGYSGWSVREAHTIASTGVLVGVSWKKAIPYVRVGGVWKIASSFVRQIGIWKKSV